MIYPNSKMFIPIYKKESGPQPGPDYPTMPLTFKSTGDTTVKIDKANLSYKKNNGEWTAYTANDEISLNDQDTVSFSGTNTSIQKTFITTGNGTLDMYGNIDSLRNNNLTDLCFAGLFANCTNIKDASNLIIPSTGLVNGCYLGMFDGCNSLTSAP